MNQQVTTHEQARALTGSDWLDRRPGLLFTLEGIGIADAVSVFDFRTGRLLAFIGPDFPAEHGFATLEASDAEAFTAILDGANQWCMPRLRGVISGTVYAIRHGWKTPRDAKQAISQLMRKRPSQQAMILRGDRPMQRLVQAMIPGEEPTDRRHRVLAEMLTAFPTERGNQGDENRRFFLQALADIAHDNGCPLTLPSRENEHATTAFFSLVLRAREIVLDRTYQNGPLMAPVRRRLAAFACTRIALLDALKRVRQVIQN